MVDQGKRERAAVLMDLLIERMRDDSLDAVIALGNTGHGKLILDVPRTSGQPVEAMVVMGGLQLSLFETREIA